jgi:arginine exporter protein ArgO
MQNLQVGDKVASSSTDFSDVYMFSHAYPAAQNSFVQLDTATHSIRLSAGHYLYVNGVLATAASAKTGDNLETANGTLTSVTKISSVVATGLYNPHTIHGDIIVNGIRTSSYTDAVNPILAHSLLAPLRAMYSMGYNITA